MCSNLLHWINSKTSKCSQLPCLWCESPASVLGAAPDIAFTPNGATFVSMCPKISSSSLTSPSPCRILMEKLWWIVHHSNCRKMMSRVYVCTVKPLWSSALRRKRNWVQALPWFLTCSLGLPASGIDLKSRKGLYSGPSPIHRLTSMVNCGTETQRKSIFWFTHPSVHHGALLGWWLTLAKYLTFGKQRRCRTPGSCCAREEEASRSFECLRARRGFWKLSSLCAVSEWASSRAGTLGGCVCKMASPHIRQPNSEEERMGAGSLQTDDDDDGGGGEQRLSRHKRLANPSFSRWRSAGSSSSSS